VLFAARAERVKPAHLSARYSPNEYLSIYLSIYLPNEDARGARRKKSESDRELSLLVGMTLTARHVAGGIGLGLATTYAVWLHRRTTRRALVRRATAEAEAEANDNEDEDVCAICLSPPELPCVTQCGHRFCTDCFVAWWQRQPGVLGGPHLGEARCPLCTCSVVRLSPDFGAARRGGLSRLRTIVLYNVGATVTRRLRLTRRCLDAVRLVLERTALCAYAVTGVVWEVARNELHSSLVRVPPPRDERVRFFCAWQILASAFGQHLDLPMLQWVASLVLKLMAMQRDCRHALLVLDEEQLGADTILHLCVTGAWCRLLGLTVRLVHPRLPEGLQPLTPLVLRSLDLLGLLADIGACVLHVRLELAGLRGLLALVRWRRQHGAHLRALEPFERLEFGVWPLELTTGRFCRVWQTSPHTAPHDGPYVHVWCTPTEVPWEACLQLHAVPLRAMRAFYWPRFFVEVIPDWAVADLWRVPPVV
jgi:hypothetical protein